MKKYASLICLLLCITLLAGCAASKGNLPGNVEWKMTAAEVKETVGEDKLVESSSAGILNQMLTKDYAALYGERTVSLAYVFNSEDSLSSIIVQIFANDGESIDDAIKSTRAVMEATYGAAEGEDASAHWHTKQSVLSLQKVEGASGFFIVVYQPIEAHSH